MAIPVHVFANAGYKNLEGVSLWLDAGTLAGTLFCKFKSKYIYSSYVFTKEFLKKSGLNFAGGQYPYE